MSVKIGHASIDENGKISGGKAGDQTGKEVCVRDWYNKPWNVMLICTDKTLAAQAAAYMKAICEDDDFGYDQSQRTTGYLAIVKAGKKVEKATASEFDCSSLVASCYKLAGLDISYSLTTSTLRKALLATGKFKEYTDSAHIATSDYCEAGAIYLSEGHHVVMGLEKGNKAGSTAAAATTTASTTKKSTAPTFTVGKVYTLQVELKVRTGAGTNNAAKTHSQLTADAQKHDVDKDGAIDKGTQVTCKSVKTVGSDIWIKCPSGWLAAYYKGEIYIK